MTNIRFWLAGHFRSFGMSLCLKIKTSQESYSGNDLTPRPSRSRSGERAVGRPRSRARRLVSLVLAALLGLNLLGYVSALAHAPRDPTLGAAAAMIVGPDVRASWFLKELGVRRDTAAFVLGMNNVNQHDTNIKTAASFLVGMTTIAFGAPHGGPDDISTDVYRAIISQTYDDFTQGSIPPAVKDGTPAQELFRRPGGDQIKIIGLGKNENAIAPLAMIIPYGLLQSGERVAVAAPFVLTSSSGAGQPMMITSASPLVVRPDGASVVLLSGFCLDEQLSAPRPHHSYRYDSAEQGRLTPAVLDAIAKDDSRQAAQQRIWASTNPIWMRHRH